MVFSDPMVTQTQTESNLEADRTHVYRCNFCEKEFTSRYGISGHYNKHKNEPLDKWIEHGPPGSKIRRAIIKADKQGQDYQYKKRTWGKTRGSQALSPIHERVLSPEPIRAIYPTKPPQFPGVAFNISSDSLGDSIEASNVFNAPPGFPIQVTDGKGKTSFSSFHELGPLGKVHTSVGYTSQNHSEVGTSSVSDSNYSFQKSNGPMIKVDEQSTYEP